MILIIRMVTIMIIGSSIIIIIIVTIIALSTTDGQCHMRRTAYIAQSCIGKGIRRQGKRLQFLCFNPTPCRHMLLLVHFWSQS